jgi:hypothetical protein
MMTPTFYINPFERVRPRSVELDSEIEKAASRNIRVNSVKNVKTIKIEFLKWRRRHSGTIVRGE